MASAGLREELECSICLGIYTDPVTLRCGHNFCRGCIHRVLDTQEESGGYSCPECREKFQKRPPLQRNITLCNIVENFLSTQPGQEESQVFCSHCIHAPVPAVKCCLLCEVSLCENHLSVHKRSPEHVLCDPTTSCENRKCSIHKDKLLEYYCVDDASCICVSCSLAGEHRGHQVDTLNEASKEMKCKLRSVLQELMSKKENTEKRIQNLDLRRRKALEKAASKTERLTALFRDLRRCLEDLERRVLTDISRQTEWMVLPYDEVIGQLQVEKDDLSKKIQQIEMLCNMTDALTIVQTSVKDGLCGTEEGDNEDTEGHDKQLHDGRDLDVASISCTLHRLSDILTRENVHFYTQVTADISLDVNTAHNELEISDDWKMASKSEKKQNRPKTQHRFQWYAPQVLSSQSFSSGQHYWEVDVGGSDCWRVGLCYPSIARGGSQSVIGSNKQSWGLDREHQYSVIHDQKMIELSGSIPKGRIAIYLDYEAGQIFFYDKCDPIRHLHTFTATFTEPLHAVLCVWRGCVKISGGNQDMQKMCPEAGDITSKERLLSQ